MAKPPERKAVILPADGFKNAYKRLKNRFPQIEEKLATFHTRKSFIPPIALPYEMKDHKLKGSLRGFSECHLAHDVLLIYTHEDDVVKLITVCQHSDLHRPDFARVIRRRMN